MKRQPSTPPLTSKQRVLRRHPGALCYERGWDEARQCTWWQVWDKPVGSNGRLLGMGKGPSAAWKEAERRLHV